MNVVAEMLLNDPAPATIWGVLMLIALPALVLLASPHGVSDPRLALIETAGTLRRLRHLRRQRRQEAQELIRYEGELRAAARRAERGAERWLEHWQDAEVRVKSTWLAWQEAQSRFDRARQGAAFRLPFTVPSPAEYAARERWLHLAVEAAVDRGELPVTAIGDAIAGRGWDARLHPVEQELALLRASATYLLGRHRRAVAAEQSAWHDAQLARRTADSLRREAAAVTAPAAAAHDLLASRKPQRSPARAGVAVRAA